MSSEERIKIGIEGLDEMLGGGLIKNSISAILGTYGTGKTTFGMHYIFEGLEKGEKCIYISLEEREEAICRSIKDKGWDISYLNKSLFILKLDPTDFNLAINSIKNDLPELIREFGASRVLIDPISFFEGLFDDPAARRREMIRFNEIMRNMDCSFLLTSESSQSSHYGSRFGLLEYLADTVIILRYVQLSDISEVHPAVEVVKMRLSGHSRQIKPYEIKKDCVRVYSDAEMF